MSLTIQNKPRVEQDFMAFAEKEKIVHQGKRFSRIGLKR